MPENLRELATPYKTKENSESAIAFHRIIRSVYGMADWAFRDVRPDLASIRPPILMVDGDTLSQFTKPVFDTSPYTEDEKGDIVFEAGSGVIFTSKQRVESFLRDGKKGEFLLQRIFLEEVLHAYTTFPSGKNDKSAFRIGLMKLHGSRTLHNLTPGYVYAFDLSKAEIPKPEGQVYPDDQSLHKTENLTRIVMWSLLYEHVLKMKFPKFTLLRLIPVKDENPDMERMATLPVITDVWKTARNALLRGTDVAFRDGYRRRVYDILPEKELSMFLTAAQYRDKRDIFLTELLREV